MKIIKCLLDNFIQKILIIKIKLIRKIHPQNNPSYKNININKIPTTKYIRNINILLTKKYMQHLLDSNFLNSTIRLFFHIFLSPQALLCLLLFNVSFIFFFSPVFHYFILCLHPMLMPSTSSFIIYIFLYNCIFIC